MDLRAGRANCKTDFVIVAADVRRLILFATKEVRASLRRLLRLPTARVVRFFPSDGEEAYNYFCRTSLSVAPAAR
jgi:hypothetical protein